MNEKLKSRVYTVLDRAVTGDPHSQICSTFIISLIILNVLAVMLETVEELSLSFAPFFEAFEVFSVAIFTIEYLLRVWSCTADENYSRPFLGRLRFALTPLALIDIIAILPFYLPMIIPVDLRFIRVLRLIRLFRVFKLGRYSNSLRTLGKVLRNKREQLSITLFITFILLVVASSLMYFFENDVQPGLFPSIPAAMWWGVSTLTTVGYGEVYPITLAGKILGMIIAVLGIGLFALPAGILGSGFVEEMQRQKGVTRLCPHCGKDIKGN